MTILVPLTRAEIMLPPADLLRGIMLKRWEAERDNPQPKRQPARRRTRTRVIATVEVPSAITRKRCLEHRYPLDVVQQAAHDSIRRCDWCGGWTCGEKYQRVPHTCRSAAA